MTTNGQGNEIKIEMNASLPAKLMKREATPKRIACALETIFQATALARESRSVSMAINSSDFSERPSMEML